MKIYQLYIYSEVEPNFGKGEPEEKELSFSYHSSKRSVQDRIKRDGKFDEDFNPIKSAVSEIHIKNKEDMIKELNWLGDFYLRYYP